MSSHKGANGQVREQSRGSVKDCLVGELWRLSTSVKYGGKVDGSSFRRGQNLISQ